MKKQPLKEKLKQIGGGHLLNESTWDNRKFGEPLPTMEDYKTVYNKKHNITEVDFEKVKIPSQVKRFLAKFVDSVKSAGLNRIKRSAVLYKIIDALGISPQQLMADISKIKKEL